MTAPLAPIESTGTHPAPAPAKPRTRAEAIRQGMAGTAVLQPREDAAEVERLAGALRAELKPIGEVGDILVRRMAVHSVRMDRAAVQEAAAISARVRLAVEGCKTYYMNEEQAGHRRAETGNQALFDDSHAAILAKRYEAASERAFHRAYNELRRMRAEADRAAAKKAPAAPKRAAAAPAPAPAPPVELGSFFPASPLPESPAPKRKATPAAHREFALASALLDRERAPAARCDIPIAAGRAR